MLFLFNESEKGRGKGGSIRKGRGGAERAKLRERNTFSRRGKVSEGRR